MIFYARPEPLGARNLFEIGLMAIREAVGDGHFDGDWRFTGVGVLGARRRSIPLGGGHRLNLRRRRPQSAYREMLGRHDVGMALLMTLHPGLVPLEMPSAGMLTVTNTYETKTRVAIVELSKNLIPVEPTVAGVKQGLIEAALDVANATRRAEGSDVRWSTTWEGSLSPELVGRIRRFLLA